MLPEVASKSEQESQRVLASSRRKGGVSALPKVLHRVGAEVRHPRFRTGSHASYANAFDCEAAE